MQRRHHQASYPARTGLFFLLSISASAHAGGEVIVRGAYYKEKATRVVQPMTDVRLEIGPDTEIAGHFLIDSITSASAAAGAEIGRASCRERV